MRYALTAVAAIAVSGFFALSSANAEPTFVPGGPIQQGGLCQVTSGDTQYYGHLAPCPAQAAAPAKKKKKKS